ncbi:pyridoxal phosphate-dependent decarboxylase family protein [Actinomadura rubrisoli]|uniref:Aminotransferase class V-fold PLP-dependent enzyme n=1 Tax=Actinomadura rubrisoli TaxID=2530368 RepID=A0A4V2YUM9_9ACTN|nr:aminotransferase class V-fold PLP-dependent enzyme [Actinomadura rubrisoli]TDD77767.1 aminotransferase class V-fold PLP-dependent enzyme [Actinomadura rubrisoli]
MTDEPRDWLPAEFEEHGRELLATIREHFESIRDVPVTVPRSSADLMASLRTELPETGEDFARILGDTREQVMPYVVHWNHPSFYGYFANSASFPGILAETLSAALNVNAMLWKSGPAASALERVVLGWLAQLVGYPEEADGVLVNGASLATLYALAAARDAALGDDVRVLGTAGRDLPVLRVYTSDQAHSSVEKAAITLGLGQANVLKLRSDEQGRLRADTLDEAIRRDLADGVKPVAVVATVGTTSIGAADPVPALAEVCARHGVWLHVDAAYGGFWRVAPSLADSAEDLTAADSLVVNPHKCLYAPMEVTAFYCRRRGALARTFRLVPEYLTSPQDDEIVDFMDLSPQLGRSFRALKVWWIIRSFGRQGLADRLEHSVRLAEWLRGEVARHPDWRCPVTSIYPLVCLRFEPEGIRDLTESDRRKLHDMLNADIVGDLNASGDAFVSHTVLDDGYVIRVSIGNIHTSRADVERLWRRLTEIAERRYAQCADAASASPAGPRHETAS